MEFQKERVFTAINADELKVGSQVIVGDSISELKDKIKKGGYDVPLYGISDESESNRFLIGDCSYSLAYLISESEEKKLKWTDLELGDIITNGTKKAIVTYINTACDSKFFDCHILAGGYEWLSDDELKDWEKSEE